jgi:Flp pilus assembly pilin Flp
VVRAGDPSLRRAPSGQGLVEYGIILGLAALVIVLLLVVFDDQVAAVLAWLSGQLP